MKNEQRLQLEVRIKAVVDCALGIGLLHGREGENSGRVGIDSCKACSEALDEDVGELRSFISQLVGEAGDA